MTNVITLSSGADFELLDMGTYRGTVVMVTQGMSQFDPKKPPKPRLTWDWELVHPETGETVSHKSWTSASTNSLSTLPPLLEALGVDVSSGELDLDACVGRSCMLSIIQGYKLDGVTKCNKTSGYAPIKKRVPPGTAPSAPARKPAPAVPFGEDDPENDEWAVPAR